MWHKIFKSILTYNFLDIFTWTNSCGFWVAGGGIGGGPLFMLGTVDWPKFVLLTLLLFFSTAEVRDPTGFNLGIPVGNNPPSPMGPPLLVLMPLFATLELFSLLCKEEEFPDSPLILPKMIIIISIADWKIYIFYNLPLTTGALLSTVIVFFKVLPALIDWRSKFLSWSATPEPDVLKTGGGGGGGAGILIQFL